MATLATIVWWAGCGDTFAPPRPVALAQASERVRTHHGDREQSPKRPATAPNLGGFSRLGPPNRGEWRMLYPEPGQTVAAFLRAEPRRPSANRRTIYLVHVAARRRDATPEMAVVARFVGTFFGLPVRVLRRRTLGALGIPSRPPARIGAHRLRRALARLVPRDAFALLALTDIDLTSRAVGPVFGEASARRRVGVASVARLHLGFYAPGAPSDRRVVLRRTLALVAHELGHLFGIEHCTAYECVMNGVASLRELDNLPAQVCPAELRKLELMVGFDPLRRYKALARFYAAQGLDDEAHVARQRTVANTR